MSGSIASYVMERPWCLTLIGPCAFLVCLAVTEASTLYRLSKINGVRAHMIAKTPFGAIKHLWTAARMQTQNLLPEYFASFFDDFEPSDLRCAELHLLGHRMIITEEPEHVKSVFVSRFAMFGKGSEFRDLMEPFLGHGVFTADGQQWNTYRSLLRPMLMTERIRDMDVFERWSNALMSKLPPSGVTIDVCDLLYRMTLDLTTDFLLGQSTNSLKDPSNDLAAAFDKITYEQINIFLARPMRLPYPKGVYKKNIKKLEAYVQPLVEAALALTPEELNKLSKSDKEYTFLHNIALNTRHPKVIRDQIMAVLLAGRDTVSAILSWALYEMSNYPDIWQKLRILVLERVGPTERPTYGDLKDLTYLTHCLNETLRLHPVLLVNARICLSDTTIPGKPGEPDIAVLEGDAVVFNFHAMNRRKDLYPPISDTFADPAIFSPDRWNHWTPKPWHIVPFNAGPRVCLGQNFAMMEMAFVLVKLLQKYERLEYRGDWAAQFCLLSLVGRPGQGVPVAFYEPGQ